MEKIVEKIESIIDDLIELLGEVSKNHSEVSDNNVGSAILKDGLAAGCIMSSASCLQAFIDSYEVKKGDE